MSNLDRRLLLASVTMLTSSLAGCDGADIPVACGSVRHSVCAVRCSIFASSPSAATPASSSSETRPMADCRPGRKDKPHTRMEWASDTHAERRNKRLSRISE